MAERKRRAVKAYRNREFLNSKEARALLNVTPGKQP